MKSDIQISRYSDILSMKRVYPPLNCYRNTIWSFEAVELYLPSKSWPSPDFRHVRICLPRSPYLSVPAYLPATPDFATGPTPTSQLSRAVIHTYIPAISTQQPRQQTAHNTPQRQRQQQRQLRQLRQLRFRRLLYRLRSYYNDISHCAAGDSTAGTKSAIAYPERKRRTRANRHEKRALQTPSAILRVSRLPTLPIDLLVMNRKGRSRL